MQKIPTFQALVGSVSAFAYDMTSMWARMYFTSVMAQFQVREGFKPVKEYECPKCDQAVVMALPKTSSIYYCYLCGKVAEWSDSEVNGSAIEMTGYIAA